MSKKSRKWRSKGTVKDTGVPYFLTTTTTTTRTRTRARARTTTTTKRSKKRSRSRRTKGTAEGTGHAAPFTPSAANSPMAHMTARTAYLAEDVVGVGAGVEPGPGPGPWGREGAWHSCVGRQ